MRREWISRCKQNTRHERLVFSLSFFAFTGSSLRIFRWLSLLPSLLLGAPLMHCYPLICLSFPKHQVFQTLLLHFFLPFAKYRDRDWRWWYSSSSQTACISLFPAVYTCNSSSYRVDMRQSFLFTLFEAGRRTSHETSSTGSSHCKLCRWRVVSRKCMQFRCLTNSWKAEMETRNSWLTC